jgi:NAD(P)-dependent dehydrogenase (short-subunit alcohol dehydrogenase family)
LESTRQLALHFSGETHTNKQTTIYLLCRSEEKAKAAIEDIQKTVRDTRGTNAENVRLEFARFDACDDPETIRKSVAFPSEKPPTIGGILLNAGGFGDTKTPDRLPTNAGSGPTACPIAKLNLIGHVVLVRHLLKMCPTDAKTRIVAVGSEACFATPGIDYRTADFSAHLTGTVPKTDRWMGTDYAWTKGILALYWAAYARHHPQRYVLIVSPGAVPSTNLLDQTSVSPFLKGIARITQWGCFGGSHTVEAGAERCTDALLGKGVFAGTADGTPPTTGSFWASTRGFARDFGNVASLSKGRFVADIELQDKVWAAVHAFVPP